MTSSTIYAPAPETEQNEFEVGSQRASTMGAPYCPFESPTSLPPLARMRDFEQNDAFWRLASEYFSTEARIEELLADYHSKTEEIEGGVKTIERHRKVLYSEVVDLSNLPKRRRSIPQLGPDYDDDE